jgi:hypothetical protein
MKLFKKALFFVLILNFHDIFSGTMSDTELLNAECNIEGCNHPTWAFGTKALYLQVKYGHDSEITEMALVDNILGYPQLGMVLKGYGWGAFSNAIYHFSSEKALDLNFYYLDYRNQLSGILP